MSPSDNVKQAWPRNVTSIVSSILLLIFGWGALERAGQLEADGDADEHPQPGLLGEQRLDRPQPGLPSLSFVASRTACSWAASNQPPSAIAAASTRCSEGAARITTSWASRNRVGSVSSAIAASSSASV